MRASAPGERRRTVAHHRAPHRGSEYAASERPALMVTASHREPTESVVVFATPNRPPAAPHSPTETGRRPRTENEARRGFRAAQNFWLKELFTRM